MQRKSKNRLLFLTISWLILSFNSLKAETNPALTITGTEKLLIVTPDLRRLKPQVIFEPSDFRNTYAVQALKESNLLFVMNVNYFDPNNKPLGLIIEENKQYNSLHSGGNVLTGILTIQNQKPQILSREQYKNLENESFDLALQAGPRLLVNGIKTKLLNSIKPARRSGCCITKNNDFVFFITKENKKINFDQLQTALLTEIDCQDALNFDGGRSSQASIKISGERGINISSAQTVPVFIGLSSR